LKSPRWTSQNRNIGSGRNISWFSHVFNGNSRILNWRYVSTIFQAKFRILEWPFPMFSNGSVSCPSDIGQWTDISLPCKGSCWNRTRSWSWNAWDKRRQNWRCPDSALTTLAAGFCIFSRTCGLSISDFPQVMVIGDITVIQKNNKIWKWLVHGNDGNKIIKIQPLC
jgi:hypothetical protein